MHISEGVLPGWMLISGWVLTAGGMAIGLKKLDYEKIPAAALLAAAFFVASLVHVPLGPTSVHLLLNGLAGILLGWVAFPVIFVGLLFQALLFQFGGITVLGVNTFNMAFPGVVAYYVCKPLLKKGGRKELIISGIIAALIGVMLAGIFVAIELFLTGQAFRETAELVLVAHIPVAAIEAVINSFVLLFLQKNAPEILKEVVK